MTTSPTDWVRTPSHLKWLLNERAMLCGEVALRERSIQALLADQAKLSERIQDLDVVMAVASPQLNPGAAGVVRAIKSPHRS